MRLLSVCVSIPILVAGVALRAEPVLETSELFPAGMNGIARYSILGMVVTTKGTVLAHCEARRKEPKGQPLPPQ